MQQRQIEAVHVVHEAVFAELLAVIGNKQHERFVEDLTTFEVVEKAPDFGVHVRYRRIVSVVQVADLRGAELLRSREVEACSRLPSENSREFRGRHIWVMRVLNIQEGKEWAFSAT